MLAQARTCGARKRDLALFHPSELIALVWFANVPMVSRPGDPNQGFLFDRFNQHVTAFWNAYRKHPEKSLLLVGRIRGSLFDRRWAAVIQALAENPGATDREISERVGVLTGGMPLDTETTKKYRQRMFKAAARSGPEDGFARAMKKLKELGLLESNLVGAIIRQEEGKGTNRGE